MSLPLAGKRILVVEDHFLLADALVDCLEIAGAEVVGPCPSVETAFHTLKTAGHVDMAVLDVQLDTETSEPIADLAREMGLPVLLMTGFDQSTLPRSLRGLPACTKPFDPRGLVQKLQSLEA